jgi:hypothetical protein
MRHVISASAPSPRGGEGRSALLAIALIATACSSGEPHDEIRPLHLEPPPVAPADPHCVAYCRRSLGCAGVEGAALDTECARECAAGGRYTTLDEGALACADRTECAAFEECMNAALAAFLDRRIEAAPEGGQVEPIAEEPTLAAPEGWPDGVLLIPGGTALPPGPDGAPRMSYGTSMQALETLLRLELSREWTLSETTVDRGTHRFTAHREDRALAFTIREADGRTLLEASASPPPADP